MSSAHAEIINRRFPILVAGALLVFLLAGIGLTLVWYRRTELSEVTMRHDLLSRLVEGEHTTSGKPAIDAAGESYRAIFADSGLSRRIWIRDLLVEPTRADRKIRTFWQFTDRARVAGITTYVNLDLIDGVRVGVETP